MRAFVCTVVTVVGLTAHPAFARSDGAVAAFWQTVQARCDASAAKSSKTLGRRIARVAIEEFMHFGGHKIDANGRMFHFGQTEAEHEQEHSGDRLTRLGDLGWWQVIKYWRSLYDNKIEDKLEVRGYRDASTATDKARTAVLLRTDVGELLHAADAVTDPDLQEIVREAVLRAAVIDTPWSAAFISYVIRQAGVAASAFKFANAHRVFIYDAFAASAAEETNEAGKWLYRACPLTTRPRLGDLICQQRESALADASDETVRAHIRAELTRPADARTVRHTHCEVVVHVDEPARKVYTIGGNVNQSVTARKLNLRDDLKFSAVQKSHCGGPGEWTLPDTLTGRLPAANLTENCSLNDRKWFVLLQLR
jgi:hypothetical protein